MYQKDNIRSHKSKKHRQYNDQKKLAVEHR